MNTEAQVLARFAQDVEDHKVTVKHDDGLYRHLIIKAPGTSVFWFELITTPGQLTIRGDMGTYVFAREQDMFDWFVDDKRAGNYINPSYWAEKLEAVDRNTSPREYKPAVAKQVINERAEELREAADFDDSLGFWHEIADLKTIDDEHELRQALDSFEYEGESFVDTYEWDFTDYSYRFIWCLHAIVFGIKGYRAWRAVKPLSAPADERINADRRAHDEGRGARVATWAGGTR